jgi:hypothetical protein
MSATEAVSFEVLGAVPALKRRSPADRPSFVGTAGTPVESCQI